MIDDFHLQSDAIGKIGESAVQMFFQRWCWHPRKDTDDQGIDFSVEIPRAPDGVRRRFLVQVKTSKSVAVLQSGDWSVPVEQGALRKYRATREPVLILAYDLPTQQMRFLHAQRWIAESGHPLNGPKHAELQIRFARDKTVLIDRMEDFQSAVMEAWVYQDARHFPAPQAIQHMESELSELDSRFKLDVTASKHGYQIEVRAAAEPVETSVTIAPSSFADAEGFNNAIRFGSVAKLNVDDLQMQGSPLFERMPRGPAIVELGSIPTSVMLRFGLIREKKPRNALRKLIEIPGEMTKGSHGVEVRTADSRIPLRFAFRSDAIEKQAKVDLSFLPERLVGLPLKSLGARKLHDMLRAGADGCLGMQVILGDQPSPGPIHLRTPQHEASAFLPLALQAARLVGLEAAAQRGKSELRWGSLNEITVADEDSWLAAWRLFNDGTAPVDGQTLKVNAAQPDVLFNASQSHGIFILSGAEFTVTGWGMEICRLPVLIEFHGYKVVRTGEDTARIEPDAGCKTIMRLKKRGTFRTRD